MPINRSLRLCLALLLAGTGASFSACGGSSGGSGGASCKSLCSAAQKGQCTSITGDCGNFCTALDDATPKSMCQSQHDAYTACLDTPDTVCDHDCMSEETDLESCIGAYCLQHTSDKDCQTLIGSFGM